MKKTAVIFLIVLLSAVTLNFGQEHFLKDSEYRKMVENRYLDKSDLANNRAEELFNAFENVGNIYEAEALKFLYAFMPLCDLAEFNGKYLLKSVLNSINTKDEFIWGDIIPEEIFRHFVIPVRVDCENPDYLRNIFYEELHEKLKYTSMKDAALKINKWCLENITNYYKAASADLIDSYDKNIFLVSALRSVSIPARLVYVPDKHHSDKYCAWTEAWIAGKWNTMNGCDTSAGLNSAKIAENARNSSAVFCKVYGVYKGEEPIVFNSRNYILISLFQNYSAAKKIVVRVTDVFKKPCIDVNVDFKTINNKELNSILQLKTNEYGLCELNGVRGNVLIFAAKDSLFTYKKITAGETDTVEIRLGKNIRANFAGKLTFNLPVINDKGKVKTSMQKTDYIGNIKNIKAKEDSIKIFQLAAKYKLNSDTLRNVIKMAGGNTEEITKFIDSSAVNNPSSILMFLNTISEKQLRLVSYASLMDHFTNAKTYIGSYDKTAAKIFENYILAPEVDDEKIDEYRALFQKEFNFFFINKAQKKNSIIIDWVNDVVKTNETDNDYGVPIPPKGVYELKTADKKSKDIFYTALCRSIGIPARINSITKYPQFFGYRWYDVVNNKVYDEEKGTLEFGKTPSGVKNNYLLARFINSNYKTIDIKNEANTKAGSIELPAGYYLLINYTDKDKKTILADFNFFKINKNEKTKLK